MNLQTLAVEPWFWDCNNLAYLPAKEQIGVHCTVLEERVVTQEETVPSQVILREMGWVSAPDYPEYELVIPANANRFNWNTWHFSYDLSKVIYTNFEDRRYNINLFELSSAKSELITSLAHAPRVTWSPNDTSVAMFFVNSTALQIIDIENNVTLWNIESSTNSYSNINDIEWAEDESSLLYCL